MRAEITHDFGNLSGAQASKKRNARDHAADFRAVGQRIGVADLVQTERTQRAAHKALFADKARHGVAAAGVEPFFALAIGTNDSEGLRPSTIVPVGPC